MEPDSNSGFLTCTFYDYALHWPLPYGKSQAIKFFLFFQHTPLGRIVLFPLIVHRYATNNILQQAVVSEREHALAS